jgi:hypothetical protein
MSFMRLPGILAGVAIAALTAVAPAAQAMPAVSSPIKVPCSADALVAAISTANTQSTAVLNLAAGCTYDIVTPATVSDGLPIITGRINIVATNTVIRRSSSAPTAFRILDVSASGTLNLSGVSIMNGRTASLGGGIQNAGTVVINQAEFSGNTAGNGGALANLTGATATVQDSHMDSNSTTGVGGGAIINSGTLTVTGSTLSGNSAPINGGGLNTQAAGVSHLIRSFVTGNTSGSLGGGISNLGTLLLDFSYVLENTGSGGGGIATGNTNVTLTNSSVHRNTPDNCSPLNTIPGCVN